MKLYDIAYDPIAELGNDIWAVLALVILVVIAAVVLILVLRRRKKKAGKKNGPENKDES